MAGQGEKGCLYIIGVIAAIISAAAASISSIASSVSLWSLVQQNEQTSIALRSLAESRDQHARELKVAYLPYVAIPTQQTSIPFRFHDGKVSIINDDDDWLNPRFIVNYGNGPAIDVQLSWDNIEEDSGRQLSSGCGNARISPMNLLPGEAGKITGLPCYITEDLLGGRSTVSGEVSVRWRDVREIYEGGEERTETQAFSMKISRIEGDRYAAVFEFHAPFSLSSFAGN